jgi:Cu+-exporting ATPase
MPKAKDPVCGMTVDTEKATTKGTYGTEAVYFCSESCKRTYEDRRGSPIRAGRMNQA